MKIYISLLIFIQFVSIYPQLMKTTGDRAVDRLRRIYSFSLPLRTRILDQSDLRVQRKYGPPSRIFLTPKSTQFLCQMCLKLAVPNSLDSNDCSRYCSELRPPPFFNLDFGRRF